MTLARAKAMGHGSSPGLAPLVRGAVHLIAID